MLWVKPVDDDPCVAKSWKARETGGNGCLPDLRMLRTAVGESVLYVWRGVLLDARPVGFVLDRDKVFSWCKYAAFVVDFRGFALITLD